MQRLKNILLKSTAILMLVAFFLSTSGFTLYKHVCNHDGERISIAQLDDCCTEVVVEEPVSCCSEPTVSHCATTQEESDCCEDDKSYFKLNNSYLQSGQDKVIQPCAQSAIIIDSEETLNSEKGESTVPDFNTRKKKPDQQLHLLYQRVKLDPPLI